MGLALLQHIEQEVREQIGAMLSTVGWSVCEADKDNHHLENDKTKWLTQVQKTEVPQATSECMTLHLKEINVYGEQSVEATSMTRLQVQKEWECRMHE